MIKHLNLKKFMGFITVLILMFFNACGISASAEETYLGYNYDYFNGIESVPNGYMVEKVLLQRDFGDIALNEPKDIFCRDNQIYILDSGNNRVIVLDSRYKVVKLIDSFTLPDGTGTSLYSPEGLFVTQNEELVIADTENSRVLFCDLNGKITQILTKPESGIFPDTLEFKPKRVVVDKYENTYVLCAGFYYGAIVYKEGGIYDGFFGSNPVEASLMQIADIFWRKIMTDKQRETMSDYVPIEYNSLDIDNEGFIYTCTMESSTYVDQIKKLNALGVNILRNENNNSIGFGEKDRMWYKGQNIVPKLYDLDVSDEGFISVVDYSSGKIFQYDNNGNLLFIFGGIGNQTGLQKVPVAIENYGDRILLLDQGKNSLTIFEPTEYGKLVRESTELFSEGLYIEALDGWNKVLKFNANSEIAYKGIGRAYLQQDKYKEAMTYLKMGQDRYGYSRAWRAVRSAIAREYFGMIAIVVLVFIFLLIFKKAIKQRLIKLLPLKQRNTSPINPLQVISHPIDGFDDLRKINGIKPFVVALGLNALWILVNVLQRQGTGFIFNNQRPDELNILLILGKTIGVLLLWTIAVWISGSLQFGEANLKQTFIATSYSFLPLIISGFICVILSNVLVIEEEAIISIVQVSALVYTVFLLLVSLVVNEQYSFKQTIQSLVINIVAILIILFVLVLGFSLLQQFFIFLQTIFTEIMFRL